MQCHRNEFLAISRQLVNSAVLASTSACSVLSAGSEAASAINNKFATSNGKCLWASEGKGRSLRPTKGKFLFGIFGVRRSREYRTRPRIKCYGPHRGRGGTPPSNLLPPGLPTVSARTCTGAGGVGTGPTGFLDVHMKAYYSMVYPPGCFPIISRLSSN